jgi:hypothetical protein
MRKDVLRMETRKGALDRQIQMEGLGCCMANAKAENANLQSHAPELSVLIMRGQIVLQRQNVQTALVSHIQDTIRRNGEGRNGSKLGIG